MTGAAEKLKHQAIPLRHRVPQLTALKQSHSQSFVPLDQRSETESSGSIHFEITIRNNRILVIRFTAQSQSASMPCYGACLKWILPELSFSDRWNVAKQKAPWVEQWLCTCLINLYTFLSRPLQRNDVTWLSSANFGERERRQLIFCTLIWNSTLALHI